jgi:hypothetical protein
MLDLTRLEDTEPFDLDDVVLFTDLSIFGYQWSGHKALLGDYLYRVFQVVLSGCSINFTPELEYLADVHIVFKDLNPKRNYLNWDVIISGLKKFIQRWRYERNDVVFHICRWSHLDDTHWFHLVCTSNPSRFKSI